jgi:hypothetical protein
MLADFDAKFLQHSRGFSSISRDTEGSNSPRSSSQSAIIGVQHLDGFFPSHQKLSELSKSAAIELRVNAIIHPETFGGKPKKGVHHEFDSGKGLLMISFVTPEGS